MKNLIILSLLTFSLVSCGSNSSTKIPIENSNNGDSNNQNNNDDSSSNEQEQNDNLDNLTLNNISLQECINRTKIRDNLTSETLKTLSCSNLTTKNFSILNTLSSLESISFNNTTLNANDISTIFSNVNKRELKYISMENNSLTKASVDRMGNYASFPNVKYFSLKGNKIEGLAVIDYFVNLETLNLEGSTYPQNRLHHASSQNNLKIFYMGSNPNVRNLNDFVSNDRLKIKNTLETLDITNMPNLTDITALREFTLLKKVIIDQRENTLFGDTLRSYNLEIDLK